MQSTAARCAPQRFEDIFNWNTRNKIKVAFELCGIKNSSERYLRVAISAHRGEWEAGSCSGGFDLTGPFVCMWGCFCVSMHACMFIIMHVFVFVCEHVFPHACIQIVLFQYALSWFPPVNSGKSHVSQSPLLFFFSFSMDTVSAFTHTLLTPCVIPGLV